MSSSAPDLPAVPLRPRALLVWLSLSQLLVFVALVPWFLVAGLSLMAFDAGMPDTLSVWALLLAIWSYPVLPVGLSLLAWRAYAQRRARRAVILSATGLACTVPLLLYLGTVSV